MSASLSTAAPNLSVAARADLVRRGETLSRITLVYNSFEGIASMIVGVMAGSISLVGFGVDSTIEVLSSVAALWRLQADAVPVDRKRVEATSLRIIGCLFIALALYVGMDAVRTLYVHKVSQRSPLGILVAASSVIVMPLLSRAKKRVAIALGSRALHADATQTNLCTWLSAIVLAGLVLNAYAGWWWSDAVAALCMTPIIAKEGFENLRGEQCDDCA